MRSNLGFLDAGVCMGLTCGLAMMVFQLAAGAAPSEYEMKAAFLYNFAKFVEWPTGAFEGTEPLKVCVLGTNPFGVLLQDSIRNKKIQNRDLLVEEMVSLAAAEACHIVFISSSERGRLDEVLARLGTKSILTVSDMESFADRGGMIGLTTVEKKVRFEVNMVSARNSGLKLSSQLLKVAISVIGHWDPSPH